MLAGLNAALLLVGVWAPVTASHLSNYHGHIMVLGFMGTVIALERAQALRQVWAYLAPATLGAGGIMLAFGQGLLGTLLLAEGALLFIVVYVFLWRRAPLPLVAVQVLSAVMAFAAAALMLVVPIAELIPVLAAFIVLTIASERAELAQLTMGARAIPLLVTFAAALSLATVAHLLWPGIGSRLFGLVQLLIALWLVRDDIPLRMIRTDGLRRYNAAALLAGYFWLALGGATWLVTGGHAGTVAYDVVIHTTFLGFGVSMIMAHAPIIFPTVLGRPLPYRPYFYVPLTTLHVGLAIRVVGDFMGQGVVWQVGSVLTVVSLVFFLIASVTSVVTHNPEKVAA
ncbi:MAG: hypothetical protein GX596_08625 [Propionibacterium sp.]|nr:hypothetical protein [Propionibacterium sp.]